MGFDNTGENWYLLIIILSPYSEFCGSHKSHFTVELATCCYMLSKLVLNEARSVSSIDLKGKFLTVAMRENICISSFCPPRCLFHCCHFSWSKSKSLSKPHTLLSSMRYVTYHAVHWGMFLCLLFVFIQHIKQFE